MSETGCHVILYHEDINNIEKLSPLFSPTPSEQERPDFGGYSIVNVMMFEHAIIADIVGAASMDTESLVERLKASDPDWLFIETEYSQVGETETICLKKGNKKTTKKTLLKNIRNASRQIDLYYAVVNQEVTHLSELLNSGPIDLNMVINGTPLLFHIIQTGDLTLFKLAVESGADIHALVEKTQWFGIETQEMYVQFEVVKGMNLLPVAIEMKAKPIVKYLIDSGLDVNVVDDNGNAPINIAAEDMEKHPFVEPLVKAGADINHPGQNGWTPLFNLIGGYTYSAKKTIVLAEKWMAWGADMTYVSQNGTNALWLAMRREQSISDFVKGKGVNEYCVPDGYYDGKSFIDRLHEAILINDVKSFSAFMDNAKLDKNQQTELLHQAASVGRLEILKIINAHGIPPYLMNSDKMFAYETAEEMEHEVVTIYLKEQMTAYHAEKKKRIESARPQQFLVKG